MGGVLSLKNKKKYQLICERIVGLQGKNNKSPSIKGNKLVLMSFTNAFFV